MLALLLKFRTQGNGHSVDCFLKSCFGEHRSQQIESCLDMMVYTIGLMYSIALSWTCTQNLSCARQTSELSCTSCIGKTPSGDRAWAHVWAWCAQVLSLSIDFYVRIFVRVYSSAEKVKESATKQMYVYQSSGCDSFYTQRVARKVRHNHHFFFCQQRTQAINQIHFIPTTCGRVGEGRFMCHACSL